MRAIHHSKPNLASGRLVVNEGVQHLDQGNVGELHLLICILVNLHAFLYFIHINTTTHPNEVVAAHAETAADPQLFSLTGS